MTPRDGGPALTVHMNEAVTPGSEEGQGGLNNQEWPHCEATSGSEFPALVIKALWSTCRGSRKTLHKIQRCQSEAGELVFWPQSSKT